MHEFAEVSKMIPSEFVMFVIITKKSKNHTSSCCLVESSAKVHKASVVKILQRSPQLLARPWNSKALRNTSRHMILALIWPSSFKSLPHNAIAVALEFWAPNLFRGKSRVTAFDLDPFRAPFDLFSKHHFHLGVSPQM